MEELKKYWYTYLKTIWEDPSLSGPTATLHKQVLLSHWVAGICLAVNLLRYLRAALGIAPHIHDTLPAPFQAIGWSLHFAAAAFVLIPGVFRLGSKSALRQKGDRVFAINNQAWKPPLTAVAALLLLFFSGTTGFVFTLGCWVWLAIWHQRASYFLYDTEHQSLEDVVFWGVLKFTRSSQPIVASALLANMNNQEPAFVLQDGTLLPISANFFNQRQGMSGFLLDFIPYTSFGKMLAGWQQTTGLPALARPIEDRQSFKAIFQRSGLLAFELVSDWQLPDVLAQAPCAPSECAPP